MASETRRKQSSKESFAFLHHRMEKEFWENREKTKTWQSLKKFQKSKFLNTNFTVNSRKLNCPLPEVLEMSSPLSQQVLEHLTAIRDNADSATRQWIAIHSTEANNLALVFSNSQEFLTSVKQTMQACMLDSFSPFSFLISVVNIYFLLFIDFFCLVRVFSSAAQPPSPTAENIRKKRKLEEVADREPQAREALNDLHDALVFLLWLFRFFFIGFLLPGIIQQTTD